jgi:aryl-phospho-beta-D-glucosidase BglC (GH1 family)
VDLIRLPFRWERVQPALGGPLDPAELDRLTAAITRIATAGMVAVPSAFNYGAYWLHDPSCDCGRRTPIGSDAVTTDHFVDFWTRLSGALADDPAVVAYGIMGEPVAMSGPEQWENASQRVVDALRAGGDETLVMVPGYLWSGVHAFAVQHPGGPWIDDPAGAVRYEAHHYWDSTYAGDYDLSYAQEHAAATE